MDESQIQVSEVTPKLIRAAIKRGERLMVFDGGEPIALITGAAAELGRRRDFFVHYPHDPSECYGTCWRHDGSAESEAAAAAAGGPVPVGV